MNAYLMPGLRLAPAAIDRILKLIDPSRIDEHLSKDRFSPREAIAHMADFEPIFLQRMQAAKASPGSTVQGVDEAQMAVDHEYHKLNPSQQAAKFTADRAKTVQWLESLAPEDWDLQIVHSEKGPMSIYDQATMLVGHDMYHVEHLTQYLGGKTAGTW